jgi:hypothetical protein
VFLFTVVLVRGLAETHRIKGMKRKQWLALLGAVAIVILGLRFAFMLHSQRNVLEKSEQFTLYSLYPYPGNRDPGRSLRNFRIIGSTEIKDASLKAQLVSALYRGIAKNDGSEAGCHNPRHGIRAVKGSRIVEVTICFECHNVYFWENGKPNHQLISTSPEKLFNKVLIDAGVPLSKE